ncbi:hypothetical protein [Dyadobacter luticola]|uniref:Outer membrane protein beta-barrel domain-containing protein n=1 Tax=Dyadobacter luticola TaxID=1979387 RepID=A0A5R9KYZ1_9BACT|nr:hypothetical protein [Dyadobacter luticola]TLV01526.1 hypothetical protein FEN17_19060 [Dyadobacter luticola]
MNSYEDELNDAIQKALQNSLGNLEKMPEASVDKKIYKALRSKSRKPRPLILLSAVGLLMMLGFGIYSLSGHEVFSKNKNHHAVTSKKPVTKLKTVTDAENKTVKNREASTVNTVLNVTKTDQKKKNLNTIPTIYLPYQLPPPDEHRTVFDVEKPVNPLFTSNVVPIPVAMRLPEIGIADSTPDSAAAAVVAEEETKSVWEKLDIPKIDPVKSKSYAWLFNVVATHTFQSIYLLPSAQSRILKVSFPNSVGNLGYKFSAGVQAGGFQVLLNYSHLRWKAEYVFAVDEFKADEYASKKYVFERLGVAQTVANKLDIIGVGVNKQLNFKSRHLGRTFGQFGFAYARPLQAGSQNFLSGNISAGKKIMLNAKTDLTIGPYFEYHFMKVQTDQPSIKARPNQLGLSVGLRLNGTR